MSTDGQFFMASGNGVCFQRAGDKPLQRVALQSDYQGTVCALSFTRTRIQSFAELLNKAKQAVGLLPRDKDFGKYFT